MAAVTVVRAGRRTDCQPLDTLRLLMVAVGVLVFILLAVVLDPSGGRADAPAELHPPRPGLPAGPG